LQLVDALNLTRPDILGWSTGGDIGLMLAALQGERVGRVIGLGAEAGSNNTVLPDSPDAWNPANPLTLTQEVGVEAGVRVGLIVGAVGAGARCGVSTARFWKPRTYTLVVRIQLHISLTTDLILPCAKLPGLQMAVLFPPQDPSFQERVCKYAGDVFSMPNGTVQVLS